MSERLERLVNLIIALRETRVPLTTEDIRSRVAGYGHSERQSFRRMFERDKADLRLLGVPVETVAVDVWEAETGYRIDPKRYDLPPLDLDTEELTALALALQATGMGERGILALRKVGVAAGDPVQSPAFVPVGYPVDVPHLEMLTGAQVTRSRVRFKYEPAGRTAEERCVDPHALVHRRGRWYLVGYDHAREDRRAFRLDRIVGDLMTDSDPGAFDPPPAVGVDDVIPPGPADPMLAVVEADPDVAWQVARQAVGPGTVDEHGWTRFEITVREADDFVGWALEYGPQLVVREPAALRERVVTLLRERSQ